MGYLGLLRFSWQRVSQREERMMIHLYGNYACI